MDHNIPHVDQAIARTGGILTLDLSSTAGWAYGHPSDECPWFGELTLPKIGGEGARFYAFQNALGDLMTEFQPMHVCAESPLPLPALNNREVAMQQIGLRAISHMLAYLGSASWHEVDAFTARSATMGQGRMGKETKEKVVRWCWRQGWQVMTHNMGDACVVWAYYRKRLTT